MLLSDFNFDLPSELIAQDPLKKRDSSRLLVLNRNTSSLSHKIFSDLVNLLDDNCVLVLNETKVFSSRLYATKKTGSIHEILLTKKIDAFSWECLIRHGKRVKAEDVLNVLDREKKESSAKIKIKEKFTNGTVKIEYFDDKKNNILDFAFLALPPYIKKKLDDDNKYQTLYASKEGSVAAPTAGLHFTKDLIKALTDKGVKMEYVTLHIGLGTFAPIREEDFDQHKMHMESYYIGKDTLNRLNNYKKKGKRIILVGTTTLRAIESSVAQDGFLKEEFGDTEIFIKPGYKFRFCEELITNFHLPKSSLLLLVSALASRENILKAYNEAVKDKYRFFSFGDAMFITDHY